MFEKILFATTASPTCDHAAHIAFDLAKKYNSQLFVFHVMGIPSHGFSPFMVDIRTGEQVMNDKDYTDWVRDEIQNTYSKQLAEAKSCQIESLVGIPHTEILRKARKESIDLIVMGAHTRQDEEVGASRFRSIVGSTMQQVAKSARCPVLIISRPCTTCFWYFSNIVFCTDFSKASYSAFLFAYKIAQEIGCKIHLFHTVDLSIDYAGQTPNQLEIEGKIKEAKQKMKELYASKMEDFDNFDIQVWEGIPYVEILKFSRERNADLIIMAHHTKEMDPEKALLGSTVEQVVLRSACPVASVNHPDKVQ
ncbi:MAG: universal stress protein [Desulfobacterales bacterium]|nr:universal stress protein [Desulfobacterales bacterium]